VILQEVPKTQWGIAGKPVAGPGAK